MRETGRRSTGDGAIKRRAVQVRWEVYRACATLNSLLWSNSSLGPAKLPPVEFEITPEMIEAGKVAYAGWFLDLMNGEEEAPSRMVIDVFRAMITKRRA